jgi:hypothetical protein
MSDQPGAPATVLCSACTENPDGFAIELEIDLGVGKEPSLLSNFGGYRHLTF